jgi:hypothetical protein
MSDFGFPHLNNDSRGPLVMRLDRIEKQESVMVDVISCMSDPELNDTSLTCCTVNVSEMGMKVATSMPIPVATRLSLRLDFASHLFRLEVEVRWVKDEGRHYVGLHIDDSSADIVAWTRMFELDL